MKKNKFKPISLYGHEPEDILRAFMKIDPKKVEQELKKEKKPNGE